MKATRTTGTWEHSVLTHEEYLSFCCCVQREQVQDAIKTSESKFGVHSEYIQLQKYKQNKAFKKHTPPKPQHHNLFFQELIPQGNQLS